MNMHKSTQKPPPFYVSFYAEPAPDLDAGLYSEAMATIISSAMMKGGFLGFQSDRAADGRPIKIAYWSTYQTMEAWLNGVGHLLPHRIPLEACVGGSGCLWPWLEEFATKAQSSQVRAA